ncbi:hypothetical protein MXD81_03535 [Microbacteriaceae bacterium K1510]|nr:hypothetical protein [Microbacteriaceae bacterium K1510]
MRLARIILPDAGPLFSLVAIDALDLLLKLDAKVVLTDYIEWEATRSRSATAQRIEQWIAQNPTAVEIIETESGADRIRKDKAGISDKRKNIGEETVFEAVSNEYIGPGPYVFLFEDEKMLRQVGMTFFDKYPVHLITTYGLLVGLERLGIIPDADDLFARIRGLDAPLVPEARPGVRKTLIDRPHRDETGTDTSWMPAKTTT